MPPPGAARAGPSPAAVPVVPAVPLPAVHAADRLIASPHILWRLAGLLGVHHLQVQNKGFFEVLEENMTCAVASSMICTVYLQTAVSHLEPLRMKQPDLILL